LRPGITLAIEIAVVWWVMPCTLVDFGGHFGGTYFLQIQDRPS